MSFYSFDVERYPRRDIYTIFDDQQKDTDNNWDSVQEYIEYLEQNYPYYISSADFNTGADHDDNRLLTEIEPDKVPISILQNVARDLQKLNQPKL